MCAHGEGECEVGYKGRVWNIVVSTSRTCGRVAGGGVTGDSIAEAGGMEPPLGNSIITGLLRTAGWAEGAEGVMLFPAYCMIWPVSVLRYHTWTAAMFVFFFSCFTISAPCRLPSLCMTPEDDMWSSITWPTVWATCLQRVSTCVSQRPNYCTIPYAYIWTITAMSARVWAYGSWLSWTIDDNCLSPNGSNSNQCHEHSHHSTITILSFLTYHSH